MEDEMGKTVRQLHCTHAYPTSPTLAGWIWAWRMYWLVRSGGVSKCLWKSFHSVGMWMHFSSMDSNRFHYFIRGGTSMTLRNPSYGSSIQLSISLDVGGIKSWLTLNLESRSRLRSTGHFAVSVGVMGSTSMKTFSRRYPSIRST